MRLDMLQREWLDVRGYKVVWETRKKERAAYAVRTVSKIVKYMAVNVGKSGGMDIIYHPTDKNSPGKIARWKKSPSYQILQYIL